MEDDPPPKDAPAPAPERPADEETQQQQQRETEAPAAVAVAPPPGRRSSPTRRKLLADLAALRARMRPETLARLRSDQLVGVHDALCEMMSGVMSALRNKCAASPQSSSASSQSQSDSD